MTLEMFNTENPVNMIERRVRALCAAPLPLRLFSLNGFMPRTGRQRPRAKWARTANGWSGVFARAIAVALVLIAGDLPRAAQAQEGSGNSGIQRGNGMSLEWNVVGADVGTRSFAERTWQAKGTITSTSVHFRGVMRASVPSDRYTNSGMTAYIALPMGRNKKEVTWGGELSSTKELSHEMTFDLSLDVEPGVPVIVVASVNKVNGDSELLGVYFQLDPAQKAPPVIADAIPKRPPPPEPPRPLCFEGRSKYPAFASKPPVMRQDYASLQAAFNEAIKKYVEKTNQRPYVYDNVAGTLPALEWLSGEGGQLGTLGPSSQFVFVTPAERDKWEKGLPNDTKGLLPGNEVYYYLSIYEAANDPRNKHKLTLSELIFMALEQRRGNMKEAMLLAHNTFRSLARFRNNFFGTVDRDYTALSHAPDFIENNVEPLIDPAPKGRDQNNGALYHLFGTAYFEMQARGSVGENSAANWMWDARGDEDNERLAKMHKILDDDPELKLPANVSQYSKLANETEQYLRSWHDPDPDPWKYCYNVYGAQLGAWLYRERLSQRGAPPLPPGHRPTILGPLPDPTVAMTSSPLNIIWRGSGQTLTVDQRTGNVEGDFPVALRPYYEAGTKTWGTVWIDLSDQPYELMLEATQNGWAHITRMVGRGRGSFVYAMPIRQGDQFTLAMDPAKPDAPLLKQDGDRIAPIRLGAIPIPDLSGSGSDTPPTPTVPDRVPAIPPGSTADVLGSRIDVSELGGLWTGIWTRRPGTDVFDGVWRSARYPEVHDVIRLEKITGNDVVFTRDGNGGRYFGKLGADGSTIAGTASWYSLGMSWSGRISRAAKETAAKPVESPWPNDQLPPQSTGPDSGLTQPPVTTTQSKPGPSPDGAGQASASILRVVKVFDNWNTGACAMTDTARFALSAPTQITNIELWYNWRQGETVLPFEILTGGQPIAHGQLTRGGCDPAQAAWCTATVSFTASASVGDYAVHVARKRLCQNAGSGNNGFVRVRGMQ